MSARIQNSDLPFLAYTVFYFFKLFFIAFNISILGPFPFNSSTHKAMISSVCFLNELIFSFIFASFYAQINSRSVPRSFHFTRYFLLALLLYHILPVCQDRYTIYIIFFFFVANDRSDDLVLTKTLFKICKDMLTAIYGFYRRKKPLYLVHFSAEKILAVNPLKS